MEDDFDLPSVFFYVETFHLRLILYECFDF
jgi:hypothetical protein